VISCVGGVVMSAVERMDRLVYRCCAADVPNTTRCRACGVLHPTSELRAAILSPSAFAAYSLVIFIFVLLSNW